MKLTATDIHLTGKAKCCGYASCTAARDIAKSRVFSSTSNLRVALIPQKLVCCQTQELGQPQTSTQDIRPFLWGACL